MNNDENLRMLLHRLADSSPVAKMTRKGREKMIELGLSEEEADAVVQRYLCGGFDFENKGDTSGVLERERERNTL